MNARQFYEKVKEMRKAQKAYFKARAIGSPDSQSLLDYSKGIEREIDNEIKRVEERLNGQASLFPDF